MPRGSVPGVPNPGILTPMTIEVGEEPQAKNPARCKERKRRLRKRIARKNTMPVHTEFKEN